MSTNDNRPNTMTRVLAAAVEANVPTLIWGDPGAGKTAVLEQRGAQWGREVRTIAASSREAVDFMGLPMESDGRVVYSPLSWALDLNAAKKGLLVVDEITTAASTFKAFLRIVQERYVGELKLEDTVSLVALANPPEIAVDGVDLAAPVANRFLHLDWQSDFDSWLAGVGNGFEGEVVAAPSTYLGSPTPARRAHVTALVTGFLRHYPTLWNKVPDDPEAQGKAWPSARSWDNVIRVLTHLDESDLDARDMAIAGLVGEASRVEFAAWVDSADLISPDVAIADPDAIPFSTMRPDQSFAVLNGVLALANISGDVDTWLGASSVMIAAARSQRADVAYAPMRALLNQPKMVRKAGIPAEAREVFAPLMERLGLFAADDSGNAEQDVPAAA